MSFFQIYKHRLFIAGCLLGEKLANTILPKIDCFSKVEEDSSGAYQSRQVPWRSPSYNILLVALDNHTVDYLHELKGKNWMMKCPEYHKGYNGGPSSQSPCPTLPKNCYSKKFFPFKILYSCKSFLAALLFPVLSQRLKKKSSGAYVTWLSRDLLKMIPLAYKNVVANNYDRK